MYAYATCRARHRSSWISAHDRTRVTIAAGVVCLAGWLGALAGWRRGLAGILFGVSAAASLPPIHALPLLVVAFTGLIWLLAGAGSGARAFRDGWCFGFGYHVPGLYWIANALLVEGTRFIWMLPFSLFGLPAVLAVYAGLIGWIFHRLGARGASGVLVFAALWTLAEWLRGLLFTGFPWNPIGQGWTVSDAMLQVAALVGIHGLGFLTVVVAASVASVAGSVRSVGVPCLAALALMAAWAGGMLRLDATPAEAVPGVTLRIVQAGIAQHHKWQPELRIAHFRRHLELSARLGPAPVTHVIWPETAAPFFLAEEPGARTAIGGIVPAGGLAIVGAPRLERGTDGRVSLWNSLHAIDEHGTIAATYDKAHLVPFGEYVPLRRILPIDKVAFGMTDFSPGPGPRTLALPGLPPFGPLICYEAIFPAAVIGDGPRPAWLVNLTNDAWYGISSGPFQHFAMARLRAVEEGVPLVRAANTGISGVIDAHGRVVAMLGLGEAGVLDSMLPVALAAPPPFARIGNLPILGLSLIILGAFFYYRYIIAK
ncbi:MAG: apolipoprotein N-acyltransferase [Alphaproteobacteria bacterium]|nr:apolipoprotein N-acyltransferase [Alphaproteobacteria bacterium]